MDALCTNNYDIREKTHLEEPKDLMTTGHPKNASTGLYIKCRPQNLNFLLNSKPISSAPNHGDTTDDVRRKEAPNPPLKPPRTFANIDRTNHSNLKWDAFIENASKDNKTLV